MRKRRNVFIILLLAVLTIFGSIECAYAKEHSGKVVADAKYIRGKNTYLCSWHGYINESVQTSGYTDSSLYSRLHIPSAGMYVSKTGRNAKTGNKTGVEFKDKKYVTYRFTIKPTTEKGAVDGKKYYSKGDGPGDYAFSESEQNAHKRKKFTGSAGTTRDFYFKKGAWDAEKSVTCDFVITKPGSGYTSAAGAWHGSSGG